MENQNAKPTFDPVYDILEEWETSRSSYAEHDTVYNTTNADERDQLHLILPEGY